MILEKCTPVLGLDIPWKLEYIKINESVKVVLNFASERLVWQIEGPTQAVY